MTFLNADAKIATHAAVTTNVHGTGAGNAVVGNDELWTDITDLPDLLETYGLGDDLLHSHDAADSTNSTSYVKLKTITLDTLYPATSTLRVSFDLRCTDTVQHHAQGRIYKNGVAVGTQRSNNSESYINYSEDLEYAEGDTIELWAYTNVGAYAAHVRNLRITGDVETVTYREAVANNDIGVADCVIGTNT